MQVSPERPSGDHVTITPSDSTEFQVTRGIYVGATGTLTIRNPAGNNQLFSNIAPGIIHPISAIMVYATGTSATGLVAIY